jgi:hypothetical protein
VAAEDVATDLFEKDRRYAREERLGIQMYGG